MRSPTRRVLAVLVVLAGLLIGPSGAAAQELPTTADRYGTAARAALDALPDGAAVAVLASGADFADALAAAPLAAAYDAPILLTAPGSLPDSTRAALDALDVADVLVLGGPAAISTQVTNALHATYQVSRVAGADRYGTAAQAALDAFPDGADVAVLASGTDFPDALAAAPLAAAYGAPILLTAPDALPDSTRAALVELDVADVLVLGGPAAISTDVTNALNATYQVSRVAGADRYSTAAQAAVDAFPDGADVAVLASGADFPDALAAAPLAAAYGAPILLTAPDALPDATRDALAALGAADVLVMGGPAAISNAVTNVLHSTYQVSRVAGGTPSTTIEVQVFFANPSLGDPCGEVFPVTRTVPAGAPLRPTLQSLLAGPTAAEQAHGFGGWFSSDTEGLLRGVGVEAGIAHVDLADLRPVIPNASTSCGSAGLLAQLDRTVTQFPTVTRARYSLEGDEAAFYAWLQLAPPA